MTQTIVVTAFLSLDGVMQDPHEWNMPYVDETLGGDLQGELDRATGLLYGRTTFEGMAGAWPKQSGPTADRFNNLPKYVVSSTLRDTTWAPTTILPSGIASVRELRSKGDGRLLVWGSRQLVQTSAEAGLVDEYVLYVHPLLLGKGARLFDEGRRGELTLFDTKTYARGVVALRYRPKR